MAAVSSSSASASSPLPISWLLSSPNCCYYFNSHSLFYQSPSRRFQIRPISASHVCIPHKVDKSSLIIAVTEAEDQLWAASCLHVRSFHDFQPSTYGVQDHKKYLAEREFGAAKERIAEKRTGFSRVSCINATLPLSQVSNLSDDLCAECKFNYNGEDRVVVGSLDLNQCLRVPDEITRKKPEIRLSLFRNSGYKMLLHGGETPNIEKDPELSSEHAIGGFAKPGIYHRPGHSRDINGRNSWNLEGRALSALSRFGERARMVSDPVWFSSVQHQHAIMEPPCIQI